MPANSKAQFRLMQYLKHKGSPKEKAMASEFVEGQTNYKKLPEKVSKYDELKKRMRKK